MSDLADSSLSVVVPVYDEEARLPQLLESVLLGTPAAFAQASVRLDELIVVNDGSRDATAALLDDWAARDPRLVVLTFEHNRGKGAAVRAGVLSARGDVVLVTDVDLSTPLDELALLTAAVRDGADVAIGSRALPESRVLVHQPRYREAMGKAFNVLVRLLTGVPWRDTQCGFKLFRLDTARRLFELQRVERFAFDAELCVNAQRLGLRVDEVPITWRNSRDTRVTLLGSSLRMAVDLLGVAWRARRPLADDAGLVVAYPPPDRV